MRLRNMLHTLTTMRLLGKLKNMKNANFPSGPQQLSKFITVLKVTL
jgi:hypothetical protein